MTKAAILKAINALPTRERMQIVERVIRTIRLDEKVSDSPSPSGDPWYDDPRNIAAVKEAIQSMRDRKEDGVVLKLGEDIKNFLANL